MRQLLFALGVLIVATLVSPRSAGAGFFVSSHPRAGAIVGAPCATRAFAYAPPPYYAPFYNAPVLVTPYYPRPYYGFYYRPDDYGRHVVGYTFPGRR